MLGFELLQQATQSGHRSEGDVGVAAVRGEVKIGNSGHDVSIC